ncbi:MAG: glycosyltransferase family 9 protein [Leptospiraceae bacterium]|nr:glycosyltransferase family 9 protein [Leptospiraceae bacterium]MCP5512132.1 glycosyltransferase family 9 protein [Leptospiraceae bacterium]
MNLLVLRFSAMGDVALLAPALISIITKYPNVQINLITRGNYAPFFFNIPNVHVTGMNMRKYRGLSGIYRLFKDIIHLGPFDRVIDLHGSLRSILLSLIFRWKKVPVFVIDKGRKEKNNQIKRKNKILAPLPHAVDRYLKVFEIAGFPAPPRRGPWINVDSDSKFYASDFFKSRNLKKGATLWIGFAPFAGHKLKEWPFFKSENLVKLILKEFKANIFLFGSSSEEEKLNQLADGDPNVFIVSGGKLGIRGELGIMEKLDLMIGMDSSNVHLMALLKKPVIGIYGTTHPYSGFAPYNQETTGVLQVELLCRPCSIYGNTVCYRKDFACMNLIDPTDVILKINQIVNLPSSW